MSDQANKLRKLAYAATATSCEATAHVPMVVVTGARSGVGATTVAMNLAAALADRGDRVVVVDAPQQRHDLAELTGVGRDFEKSVSDVLSGKCGAADAIVNGPAGMQVLANRGRVSPRRDGEFRRNSPTVGDFSRGAQQRLLSELESLRDDVDLVVVDTGDGLSACTRRFWRRAQLVVLVTTTDDAALLDAYAALKLSSADALRPAIRLLVNKSDGDDAADGARRRIENACRRFLSLSIEALPALPRHGDETIAGANRAPRVWESPNSPFGHAALWLGRAVNDLLAKSVRRGSGELAASVDRGSPMHSERIADAGCRGPGMNSSPYRRQPASCIQ